MPKLTREFARHTEQAAGDWNDEAPYHQALEPGWYLCRLLEVEQKDGRVAPYWGWKYETVEGQRFLWDNTSLSEKAIGRLGKVFEAFGVPADTDTDELVGKLVNIAVGVETIAFGKRQGQIGNTVLGLMPGDTHPDFAAHDDSASMEPF